MRGQPFKRQKSGGLDVGSRPYIEEETAVCVRFHEVDIMGIVWHGNYVGYFEEARRAFGQKHGIDYPVLVENGFAAPVVSMWIDYHSSARMSDILVVAIRLYKSESLKIEFGYEVRQQGDHTLVASGGSVQVLTTPEHELVLASPPFLQKLLKQWESEWILP